MRGHVLDVLLLLAIVGVVAVCLVVGAPRSGGEAGEKFGGTDALVLEQLAAQGHEPWFRPLFAPGSGEVESGLFALQAATGAGVLGYCLGVLRGRRQASASDAVATRGVATAADPGVAPDAAGGEGRGRSTGRGSGEVTLGRARTVSPVLPVDEHRP